MSEYPDRYPRQQFHRPRTSMGVASHWVRLAGVAAPLIVGELVKDPDRRWRYTRLAILLSAGISEGMWMSKISKERDRCREEREERELEHGGR